MMLLMLFIVSCVAGYGGSVVHARRRARRRETVLQLRQAAALRGVR